MYTVGFRIMKEEFINLLKIHSKIKLNIRLKFTLIFIIVSPWHWFPC